MPTTDDAKLFQVKFKSGQGQQVRGASADAVKAQMAEHYGADYEIDSIQEIEEPPPPKKS